MGTSNKDRVSTTKIGSLWPICWSLAYFILSMTNSCFLFIYSLIWAGAQHFPIDCKNAQRRLRSACASAQSDQNLRRALCRQPRIQNVFKRTANAQADLSLGTHAISSDLFMTSQPSLLFSFRTKDGFFSIDWQEDGSVGIKGTDGKYLSNKQTGALFSLSSELGDQQKFKILIVNRPLLVLKGEHGFVGTKMGQYICNKAKHDMLSLEITSRDTYILKGKHNAWWWYSVHDIRSSVSGLTVTSQQKTVKLMFLYSSTR